MAKAWQTNGRHMQEKVLKEDEAAGRGRRGRLVTFGGGGGGEDGCEIHTCLAYTCILARNGDTHAHPRTHSLAITNGKLVCKQSEKGNWQMKPNLAKHTRTHRHMKRFPQATLGLKQNRYETYPNVPHSTPHHR